MLLAVAFGYYKGRNAAVVSGQSLTWTQIPLIALAIISIGPSIVAVVLYLAYTFGIIQPGAYGFRFSHVFIFESPIDFALLNWPFLALYLVCRIWPKFGAARLAMWFSVIAMSLPNVLLFQLAPEMVTNAFDAGQGIGITEAMLSLPIITIIWPGAYPSLFDAGFGVGLIVSPLMAPVPLFRFNWLVGGPTCRVVRQRDPFVSQEKLNDAIQTGRLPPGIAITAHLSSNARFGVDSVAKLEWPLRLNRAFVFWSGVCALR